MFILQYVLFKIRLYCEVLNVNIPKKRIPIKEKIFLYQITFCNQKAKIDLHHVYKRSMCLSLGERFGGLSGIVCESNRNMMMF